jgi:hypothetical protein
MHDGLMGGRALALSWDHGKGRKWVTVAILLLAAVLLVTALLAGPLGLAGTEVAAGETDMVVAGGSWSFHLPSPGSNHIGFGPSWG